LLAVWRSGAHLINLTPGRPEKAGAMDHSASAKCHGQAADFGCSMTA
jgi:hypothetical protein